MRPHRKALFLASSWQGPTSSGLIEHATHSRCLWVTAQHISFRERWYHRKVSRSRNLLCVSAQACQLLFYPWALVPGPSSPPQCHNPETNEVYDSAQLLQATSLSVSFKSVSSSTPSSSLLIESVLTDTERTAVLPYDFWRGESLHFHGKPIGPPSCCGFLHLLLPMLHADKSFFFERRNDSVWGKNSFI